MLIVLGALAPGAARAEGATRFKPITLELPSRRAGFVWGKFNKDARMDALVVEALGMKLRRQRPDGGFDDPGEEIAFDRGGLFDICDLDLDGVNEIAVLRQDGVQLYEPSPDGAKMIKREKPLISGVKGVAFQHLVSADFMFDIDNDGDEDIVFPVDGRCYLFFNKDGVFTKENQLTTRPIKVEMKMGEELLRDKIESRVTIPRLQFLDANGDGRLDLHATEKDLESFFIQSAAGEIPQKPTYAIDLRRFKDQVPKHDDWVDLDQFQFIPMDLDGDKDQDYIIVAGAKVWVFKSGPTGPNLDKPDQILKVSANYMSVVVLPVDEDGRPDLVIMKYDLPSLGRVVAGLAIGLKLEVEILGYKNSGDPFFARSPNERSVLAFKAPPIFRLLGDLDKIVSDFRALRREARSTAGGDFNADGSRDLARVEGGRLEFFLAPAGMKGAAKTNFFEDVGDSKLFRDTLFGEKRREVSLDTLFSFMSDVINEFQQTAIGGRKPDFSVEVPPDTATRILSVNARDLNGDGRDDVTIFLGPKDGKEYKLDEPQTLACWVSE